MKKQILLDMDGVLVDFNKATMKQHNLPDYYQDPANYGIFDLDKLSGLSAQDFWKPFDEEFWANMEPTPECHEIIKACEKSVSKENVCLLSSPPRDAAPAVAGKMRWLHKHLPDYFYKRRFLFGSQKQFCAAEHRILVDDSDKNFSAYQEKTTLVDGKVSGLPGPAILFPRAWNSNWKFKDNPVEFLNDKLKYYSFI